MSVLVVRHIQDNSLGALESVLSERGLEAEYAWGRTLSDEHLALRGQNGLISALVILGGKESAADDDKLPYLKREQALIRAAVKAELPVFGICLGAQMLARSLGAPVEKLKRRHRLNYSPDGASETFVKEIGWTPMTLSTDGLNDPVLSQVQGASQFQWHEDTYQLPPGATHLAMSEDCPQQAFRLEGTGTGNTPCKVYGVQFHPEVSREVIAQWLDESKNLPPERKAVITQETEACFDACHEASRRMFAAWCNLAGL